MKPLVDAIDDYLALRRGLGFQLKQTGRWLAQFATFMDQRHASFITTELALAWALPSGGSLSYGAKRLFAIRGFARYRCAADPRTEVPPPGLLPYRPRRAKPYWYTDGEIQQLMDAASALPPAQGLRGASYRCLLGLLAVTGLRIGEALALTREHVDLSTGWLTIHRAKFNQVRLVPLQPSSREALLSYAHQRDRYPGAVSATYFFVSEQGLPLKPSPVHNTFRKLCRQVGLHGSTHCDEPQLHHFRHRFAMEALRQGYRAGEAVEHLLPVLSTFLGHARIADTFWYLSAYPELMGEAVQRLEQQWASRP